jgi:hypothetical protein
VRRGRSEGEQGEGERDPYEHDMIEALSAPESTRP